MNLMMTGLPAYSLAERDRRWNLANQLMEEEQVDALIVYGDREGAFPAVFNPDTYFTNERPGSIVIFPKGEEPISVVFLATAVEDHIQARYTNTQGWIRPENMYVGKMGGHIVSILEQRGLAESSFGVIGLEPYPPYYFDGAIPYNTWNSIQKGLPHAVFKPVGRRFFALSAVKSQEELDVLRRSARIGEQMCQAMLEATKPGVRENEIYAAAMNACAMHAGFTASILMGSGPEFVGWGLPAWTYRPEEPRIIQEGDIILAEVFSSFGMLETQHQPSIAVGEVHPDFELAAAAARQSYENGVKELAHGALFGDVVKAMNKPMQEVSGWHVHPLIHSINPFGLIGVGDEIARLPEAKDYGNVHPIPSIGLDTELKAGMVFAFEPNCAIGKKVINLGGTVIVGEQGGIELNDNSTRLMRASW
ncbi:M24 family metallopeptidase [Paenibacillus aquistagni]|uniref:M24 family metallopeptidase n=1 Tax=Paenibacillus aquistagni TaxID=1852522 RepID=UPI0021669F13|nr:M24 family metallopeptidase [Paenibacillus aquistagni]